MQVTAYAIETVSDIDDTDTVEKKCHFVTNTVIPYVRKKLKESTLGLTVVVHQIGPAVTIGFPEVTQDDCSRITEEVLSFKSDLVSLYEKNGYKIEKIRRVDRKCSQSDEVGCEWRIQMKSG